MKRNKWMRALALLLGCSMMIFVAACGKGLDDSGKPEGSVVEKDTQKESDTKDGEGSGQELINLKWGPPETIGTGNSGVFTDDNYALQKIKEDLGVEIEWVYCNDEKYNMWSAGGDMPDLLIVTGPTLVASIENIVASGQFINMDELLEQYGQHILKNSEMAINVRNRKHDGTYVLPVGVMDKTRFRMRMVSAA